MESHVEKWHKIKLNTSTITNNLKSHEKIILCFIVFSLILIPNSSFASPIITHQEISIPPGFTKPQKILNEFGSLDFNTVTYLSDGNFLNATFFLPEKFNPNETQSFTYGLEIGVDAKNGNGLAGINFIFSQTWDNGKWIIKYQQITSSGQLAIIKQMVEPYEGKINQDKFINLSIDLKEIGSPDYYDVIFFSEGKSKIDNTSTTLVKGSSIVFIPNLFVSMSTNPSPLLFVPGDHTVITLQLKINANVNLPLTVQIQSNTVNGVKVNEFGQDPHYDISNGVTNIPLEVTVPYTTSPSLQIFPIAVSESFDRTGINRALINNELINATLFTTPTLFETLQLEIPVGTSPPINPFLLVAFSSLAITIIALIIQAVLQRHKVGQFPFLSPTFKINAENIPILFIQNIGSGFATDVNLEIKNPQNELLLKIEKFALVTGEEHDTGLSLIDYPIVRIYGFYIDSTKKRISIDTQYVFPSKNAEKHL